MTAPGEFDGLRALVTGGASGIGLAIADLLADRGVAVAVLDRDLSPVAGGRQLAVAAPFKSGLLSEVEPDQTSHFNYDAPDARLLRAGRELGLLAIDHGCALPQVPFHLPQRHPAVAGVMAGLAEAQHVQAAAPGLAQSVPEAFWGHSTTIVEGFL